MAEANDSQMQQYADERIRVRAEQARAFIAALRDDKVFCRRNPADGSRRIVVGRRGP